MVSKHHHQFQQLSNSIYTACSFANNEVGTDNLPITGILCSREKIKFFEFLPNRGFPRFAIGKFKDGSKALQVSSPDPDIVTFDRTKAIRETRKICEAIYDCFLKAYIRGLEEYLEKTLDRSKEEERDERGRCYDAVQGAKKALEEAESARSKFDDGQVQGSIISASRAADYLKTRYVFITVHVCSYYHCFTNGRVSVEATPIRKHELFGNITRENVNSV